MPIKWPFGKKKETVNKSLQKKIDGYVKHGSVGFMNLASMIDGYGGSKTNFLNGFGLTADLSVVDLRLLQKRSLMMFRENSFAATIFGRLETKVINTGLRLRCTPPSEILTSLTDEELNEWAGNTERLFDIWSKDKRLAGVSGKYTFGQMQRLAYKTALLSGDCLVIMSVNSLSLPQIQLVDGINLESPGIVNKNIKQGVELDEKGREIAYWVRSSDYKLQRVPAYTARGQRRAFLVRATESRIDDVRGLPILSVVLQNINEIGKYMDSEQRAALVNSYVAVVHNVSAENPYSNPLENAALASEEVTNTVSGETANFKQMQAGYMATKLSPGETISSFDTKRPNVNMGPFVETCMKSIGYSLEIPPEVLFLEFKSNFSASRQAKLDFNDYVQKAIMIFSENFTQPIYNEWLTGMIVTNQITAEGYMESLRNLNQWKVLGAWRSAAWRGLPNKSVDEWKQVKALEVVVDRGWMTNEQVADEYFTTDYNDNVRKLKKEREANGINVGGDPVTTEEQLVNLTETMNNFINSFEANNE